MSTPWYEFNDAESVQEWRDRRLLQCPQLTPSQLEQLRQLRNATWDGNLISKDARTFLARHGLVVRFNGWQVVSKEGLAILETLGELKP